MADCTEHVDTTATRERENVLGDFASTTSAHGFSHLIRAESKKVVCFWLLLIIATHVFCISQTTNLIMKYAEFGSETTYEEMPRRRGEFPDVTFCNINPQSNFKIRAGISTKSARVADFLDSYYKYLTFSSTVLDTNEGKWNKRIQSTIFALENVGWKVTSQMGHDYKDLLISCELSGQNCLDGEVEKFQHFEYNNCFTLKLGKFNQSHNSVSGTMTGLSLVLFVEGLGSPGWQLPYNTYSYEAGATGARIVIHPQNTPPLPETNGFNVPPGVSTSVALKSKLINRLDAPHGNCTHEEYVYSGSRRFEYSEKVCLHNCIQTRVIDMCNCTSPLHPFPGNHSFCGFVSDFNDVSSWKDMLAKLKCEEFFSSSELEEALRNCDCHLPCSEAGYDKSVSMAYWPIDIYQKSFLQIFRPRFSALHNAILSKENKTVRELIDSGWIRNNFLRVNIYFESPNVSVYRKTATYTWPMLLSDIGGCFGLYIGMSVLTGIEYLGLIVRMLGKACYYIKEFSSNSNKVKSIKIGERK